MEYNHVNYNSFIRSIHKRKKNKGGLKTHLSSRDKNNLTVLKTKVQTDQKLWLELTFYYSESRVKNVQTSELVANSV